MFVGELVCTQVQCIQEADHGHSLTQARAASNSSGLHNTERGTPAHRDMDISTSGGVVCIVPAHDVLARTARPSTPFALFLLVLHACRAIDQSTFRFPESEFRRRWRSSVLCCGGVECRGRRVPRACSGSVNQASSVNDMETERKKHIVSVELL